MNRDLRINGKRFAIAKLTGLSGAPLLGAQRLRLHLELQMLGPGAAAGPLLELGGDLELARGPDTKKISDTRAPAHNFPLMQFDTANTQVLAIEVDLSNAQVAALDRSTAGADFNLNLNLRGLGQLSGPEDPQSQIFAATVSQPLMLRVTQSDWVRVLREMGFANRMLFEVEFPAAPDGPLADVARCLEYAVDAFRTQPPKACVAACRGVVESLTTYLADNGHNAWPDAKASLEERYHGLRRAVWIISNLANHSDAQALATSWAREDAIAMLTVAAALVRRHLAHP